MVLTKDGPYSTNFEPILFQTQTTFNSLSNFDLSKEMIKALPFASRGECTSWGIRFFIGETIIFIYDRPVTIEFSPVIARWFIFLHTSDSYIPQYNEHGTISPMRGTGLLNEQAATYTLLYDDGSTSSTAIRRRYQIGSVQRPWGENCFECVSQHKPAPVNPSHEQINPYWGNSQTRVKEVDFPIWGNWLWAWDNPFPQKAVHGIRFEPINGIVLVSAISAGDASTHPLRWETRRKALLSLPAGELFKPQLDDQGLLDQMQLDLGQIISATPQLIYPNEAWANTCNNQLPDRSANRILIEYSAHPDASFHLSSGQTIPVKQVENRKANGFVQPVPPSCQRVTIRVIEHSTKMPVPVKIHIHGEAGEYIAPLDRHRIPNPAWFEDYSVDFSHNGIHPCTYIDGFTRVNLPLGKIYIEVSKGFEIRPIRKVFQIKPDTHEIVIEMEKVLKWREKGWVTADTHVHFLSPISAMLEGKAEGVNVINLLASQWGELMTNVGDFDGKTTWGCREAGGDGEYLVRVGTENRQHVLGHISLLGYEGQIIAPMTTGGPDESAIGDPLEILLAEWAKQCKRQGGVVVLPHFPQPRGEHTGILSGDIDAVEMTSWGNLYGGINPYSLSDWYRYLNCGYLVAAVGGTDKMSADTPVGAVRTYSHLNINEEFTYEHWKDSIRRAETFVTYGPLLEFTVEGQRMGSTIRISASGGTLAAEWRVASVTIPVTQVDLIVNGEVRASTSIHEEEEAGCFNFMVEKSCWAALLVRGRYPGKPEVIAAHSSPVMILVEGSPLLATADAVTILEQIEGSMAYLDTMATRKDEITYKRMRLVLESAHRSLHNRMHQNGQYHVHSPVDDHPEHHR